jgi:hypothetical protein
MLVIAMLVIVMLVIAMLCLPRFENSNVVCMKRCMFGMQAGNGTGSVKPFPFRAASPRGFCVCVYVSLPAISGDAVILLLWHAGVGQTQWGNQTYSGPAQGLLMD